MLQIVGMAAGVEDNRVVTMEALFDQDCIQVQLDRLIDFANLCAYAPTAMGAFKVGKP